MFSNLKEKNISGMSRTVLKDPTLQTMLGRTITLLTLRMQLLVIKATIACVKPLSHGMAWHSAKTTDAENDSKPLPRQYYISLKQ